MWPKFNSCSGLLEMLAIAVIGSIFNDVGGIEHHVPSHHQEYGILDSLKIMIPKIMLNKVHEIIGLPDIVLNLYL